MKNDSFFAFLAVFSVAFAFGVISPILPFFLTHLKLEGFMLGLFFSGFSLGRILITPVVAKISDKYNKFLLIILGLLLFSMATYLYTVFLLNKYVIILLRLTQGIGASMVIPTALAVFGENTKKGKEGTSSGIFSFSFSLGMGAGPLISGIIATKYGIKEVFILSAMMSSISLIAISIRTLIKKFKNERKVFAKKDKISFKLSELFRDLRMFSLFLTRFCMAVGRTSIFIFFPILASQFKMTYASIGIFITFMSILGAIFQLLFGKISDKLGGKFHIFIITGLLMLSFTTYALSLTKNEYMLIALFVLGGLSTGMIMPSTTAISIQLSREKKNAFGGVMGIINWGTSVGIVAGSFLLSIIEKAFGLKTTFLVASIIIILPTFLIFAEFFRNGKERRRGF